MNRGRGQASYRKSNGVVYTPSWVVEDMLDRLLPKDGRGMLAMRLCDPACGDGAFLAEVVKRVALKAGRSRRPGRYVEVLERLGGYDIDGQAVRACARRLDAVLREHWRGTAPKVRWNLVNRDALDEEAFADDFGGFTHVVGNPPYVRIQHLGKRRRRRIDRQWSLLRGATDLYLLYFELSLRLLRPAGRMAFITPSSWLRSNSGALLRRHLGEAHRVEGIVDFGQHQVFAEATTYTAITVVQKDGAAGAIPVFRYVPNSTAARYEPCGFVRFDAANPEAMWVALTDSERRTMRALSRRGTRLGEIADIRVGIQTLADRVFILPVWDGRMAGAQGSLWNMPADGQEDFVACRGGDELLLLERRILRPVVKASVMKDGRDPVSRVVIFPYDGDGVLWEERRIREEAPRTYAWLLRHKEYLLGRDKGEGRARAWYAFGRECSLVSGFGEKILTSGMNKYPNFQPCPDPEATFYSGYSVKPRGGVDMNKLLVALNSDDMRVYIGHVSRPYQNGWMSYAKSFIQGFPVPDRLI